MQDNAANNQAAQPVDPEDQAASQSTYPNISEQDQVPSEKSPYRFDGVFFGIGVVVFIAIIIAVVLFVVLLPGDSMPAN